MPARRIKYGVPRLLYLGLAFCVFAFGCRSTSHSIRCVSGNEMVTRSSYSFVCDVENKSYLYELPENDAPIEPDTLSHLIYAVLDPFITSSAGTLHSDITTVPNLSVLEQVKSVGFLLSEQAWKAKPGDDFSEFVRLFESWEWPHETSAFDSLVQVLRKAANNGRNKQPELKAILLLILGHFYEGKYDFADGKEQKGYVESGLRVYHNLGENSLAPSLYKAIALFRESRILFEMSNHSRARKMLEKLLKQYESCCSEWPFYEDARWLRIRILGLQGQDTIITLLDDCSKGDSSAVLACLGAFLYETWIRVLNHGTTTPIHAIQLWSEAVFQEKGITKNVADLLKQLSVDDAMCSSNRIKRIWLWWLQEKRNFPPQRLPEDMHEFQLLREFVKKIRKDPDLSKQHEQLLDDTLKSAEKMKKE